MNLSMIISALQEKTNKQQDKLTLLKLLKEHIDNYKNAIIDMYSDSTPNRLEHVKEVWDTQEKLEILLAGIVECTDIEKMYELGFLEEVKE